MIRVGVNLLWLRPGLVGGSEEYLARQLAPLADVAPELDVTIFATPATRAAHPELADRLTVVAPPVPITSRPSRVAAESTWLARQASRRRLDLIHHGGGTVPAVTGCDAIVLTVHDLQYLAFPEFFSTTRRRYLAVTMPRSIARAQAVCVPSRFVADTIVDAFGTTRSKLFVVPHGLPAVPVHATPAGDLRGRLGLAPSFPEQFVVYPAITHPHKNHVTLLEALARTPGIGLVLLGGAGRAEDDVHGAIERLGLADRVARPGRVSDADRDGCYRAALATAFPSRYEGFGAPVIEAMDVGCPLLAADATALPEVVGDGGWLLPPTDIEAWADALATLRDDAAGRQRWAAAGRSRAARFPGAVSARALVAAYRSVLP